jgi:hypothetical protein
MKWGWRRLGGFSLSLSPPPLQAFKALSQEDPFQWLVSGNVGTLHILLMWQELQKKKKKVP